MNNTLKPGHWCRPKDEKEWKAILDLAVALGIKRRFRQAEPPYRNVECIMYCVDVCAVTYGAHDMEILTCDFIRGMYEIAGQKEPCRPGVEQRLDDHEKRIKALEDEHDMGEFLKDGPWHIRIDPEACPKGIPFSVALEYMKAGRKARRASWFTLIGACILDNDIRFDGGIGLPSLWKGDLLATDWEVIPES